MNIHTVQSRNAMKMMNLVLSLILLGSAHAGISKPPPFMNSLITPDPTVSPAPTALPTARPTISSSPTNLPSSMPTPSPTISPTTLTPTVKKTREPSATPSAAVTDSPTVTPSVSPTTSSPTAFPTRVKSRHPTITPTSDTPSLSPTVTTSDSPTLFPSLTASSSPSSEPSLQPTVPPTSLPSSQPSSNPNSSPSLDPTAQPTELPSSKPNASPSLDPSAQPTELPSAKPNSSPSLDPTAQPTELPSSKPNSSPSLNPTAQPSELPSSKPTSSPSLGPSAQPSELPSSKPNSSPSLDPTAQPSELPSSKPNASPSSDPTAQPTSQPTSQPSPSPTTIPTTSPTSKPSLLPSSSPTMTPTSTPSIVPSHQPSVLPSSQPTSLPSVLPSQRPSEPNIEAHNSTLTIGFEHFTSPMDTLEMEIFQDTLKSFMMNNLGDTESESIIVDIDTVQITSQLKEAGVANGLLSFSRKLDESDGDEDDGPTSGLKVEVLVTGTITRGSPLPPTFSFGEIIVEKVTTDFDTFMEELDGGFIENGIMGRPSSIPSSENDRLFMTLIAVGCGVGGMVLAAGFLFIHNKRQANKRMVQYQNQYHHQMNDASPQVVLQDPHEFALNNQAVYKSQFVDEESGISRSQHWEWEAQGHDDLGLDVKSRRSGKSSRVAFSEDDSERSSAYEPEGQRDLASSYSVSMSDSSHSTTSSRNMDTPTGSASTATPSLGINLSPEALMAAQKQGQQFSFVPREGNESLGQVYPGSAALQYSHPGMNNRLAYKTVVCYAPPGPLGVIIDTTAEGPMVHSIKPTSAMLGSLAPADIVVGLDNIETRQMTAPALTRLMARKSQQPKRKITCLRPVMR